MRDIGCRPGAALLRHFGTLETTLDSPAGEPEVAYARPEIKNRSLLAYPGEQC
jgi:hypothetical protein